MELTLTFKSYLTLNGISITSFLPHMAFMKDEQDNEYQSILTQYVTSLAIGG